MLAILSGGSAFEFLVRGEDGLQGVKDIFFSLFTVTALARCARDFEHTGDYPSILIGWFEGDSEIE